MRLNFMEVNEKDAYIKYFYLIDTENLVEKIRARLTSDISLEKSFDIIFDEIENSCEQYLDFIWSPNSFNNSTTCNKNSKMILDMVLKHHCILCGFLSAVKEYSLKEDRIKISAKNDSMLRCGYFYTKFFTKKPSPTSDNEKIFSNIYQEPNIYQEYNQRKKYFNQYSYLYSYNILKNHCQSFQNDFLMVPRYEGNWARFIYMNPAVFTFNKSIEKHPNTMIKNYENLFLDYKNWYYKNNLSIEDKLLFESAIEPIYGFRFFFYALQLIHRIYTAPVHTTNITLKDLEGSLILNFIQKTAQLPIIYNRCVFLEHAVHSILISKSLKSQDYREKHNSLFSHLSQKMSPKEMLLSSGLEHIMIYLQNLKYVALPLLENLWDVVIYKLNQSVDNFCIDMNVYRSYIAKNYMIITEDYSQYIGKEEVLNKNILYKKIASKNIETMYKDFCFFTKDKKYSTYEYDSFKELLSEYLKKERFTTPEVDLYHQFMFSFTKSKTSENKYFFNDELNFHKRHVENIFSYAKDII